MLEVDINKIIPKEDAKNNFDQLVSEVANGDELYVLTSDGRPSAVIVGVHHLEKLTGQSDAAIVAKMSELANSNLGGNMEDTNMSQAAPADDTAAVAPADGTAAMPAAPADTVPAVAPADEPIVAPDQTPAAPAETQIIPEEPAAPAEDPFAPSLPQEPVAPVDPAPAAPAPEVPAATPEAPAPAPAQPAEEDGNVLPNIGGQA